MDIGIYVKQYLNKTDMQKISRVTIVTVYSQHTFKTDYTYNIITYGKMKYRQPPNLPTFPVKVT